MTVPFRQFLLITTALLASVSRAGAVPPSLSSPGLSPGQNLGDLPSKGAARANTARVTDRAPTADDGNYNVGDLWRAPDGESAPWWQLIRAGNPAIWVPATTPRGAPVSAVSSPTPLACYGQSALTAGYAGAVIDVQRPYDAVPTSFAIIRNGRLDLSALSAFLADGLGMGYIVKRYDQCGGGLHATQSVLASAPRIDIAHLANGAPALVYDYDFRKYMAGLTTYAVASFSGTVLTMSATPPAWLAPGMTVSGSNLAATTITAIDFTNKKITVSAGPTGTAGPLTVTVPKVWMDLPNGLGVPLNAHGFFTVGLQPTVQNYTQPITVGTSGATAFGSSANYAMLRLGGLSTVTHFYDFVQTGGASGGYNASVPATTWTPHNNVAVFGASRSGRTLSWWAEEKSGTATSALDPGAAVVTGGSLGFSQQSSAPGLVFGGDYESYADVIYGAPLSVAQGALLVQALDEEFSIRPQVRATVVFDGSSTTRGSGTQITEATMRKLVARLGAGGPYRSINVATGQTIEAMLQNYAITGAGTLADGDTKLLVVHPGLGNSLQSSQGIPITAQSGRVLTTSASLAYPSSVSSGVAVSDNFGCVPPGTTLVGVTPSASQVTLSADTTCQPSALNILSDTDTVAIANINSYLGAARANNYRVCLVLSAVRGTYTTQQLAYHHAVESYYDSNWRSVADCYVPLKNDPAFAGDTPWANSPQFWQADHQHFTDLGYELQASLIAKAITAGGLLAARDRPIFAGWAQ